MMSIVFSRINNIIKDVPTVHKRKKKIQKSLVQIILFQKELKLTIMITERLVSLNSELGNFNNGHAN